MTEVKNIFEELVNAPLDEKVGIKVTKITGDDSISVYSAEIAPFKKVGAHFHNSGIEIYHIVSGKGKMHTGFMNSGMVELAEPVDIKGGDCFTIAEKEVHQLENTGADRLVALFICRTSHLGDDRTIV